MSARSLPNRNIQQGQGAESGRRWASTNLAITLSPGWQPHRDADEIAANATTGLNGLEATEVQPIDPTKFLVGSPGLWKFPTNQRHLSRPIENFVP
jgi:hypothetical protein